MRTTAFGGGFEEFLASSEIIDCDHPAVKRLVAEVRRQTELQTIRAAYEAVRDRYPHSYDIGAEEVSVSASDVIRHGHGICLRNRTCSPQYSVPAVFPRHCVISASAIATMIPSEHVSMA